MLSVKELSRLIGEALPPCFVSSYGLPAELETGQVRNLTHYLVAGLVKAVGITKL